MISSGVAALILCGTHAAWMSYKANDYQFQFDELTKEKKNIDGLRKTLTSNQDKIKKLKADIATLGGSVDVIPEAMAALQVVCIVLMEIMNYGLRITKELINRLF